MKNQNIISKKEYIKDLAKLISFKSLTSDQAENEKLLDFVKNKINKRAYINEYKNNNASIFIASNVKTLQPDICFLAHTDVVPGSQKQFLMKMKKGVAFGRGVSDMKFSIPIGYKLLNTFIESNLKASFALVLTTDEETGGFNGAKYLVDKVGFKPKVIIVPDGGDDLIFVNKAKGVCSLKVSFFGKPAHSSRIWEGKNALESVVKLCNEVLKRYGKNNQQETWKTTVNIGIINGGIAANQVCPEAYVILDFRFPETTTFEKIYNEIISIAKNINDQLAVVINSIGQPTKVNINIKVVKQFISCFEQVYSQKIIIKPTYGASDARHFANLKVPILMIKPIGGDIHGDNENVSIDSCLKFYEALKLFIEHKK